MAIYIRDSETEALVRALARKEKRSLKDAIKGAVQEKLTTLEAKSSLHNQLSGFAGEIQSARKTGKRADKKFFDALSGHR